MPPCHDQSAPVERITDRIYLLRGKKVLMDRDLAELYGVPTKALKQALEEIRIAFLLISRFRLQKMRLNVGDAKMASQSGDAGAAATCLMLSSAVNGDRAIEVKESKGHYGKRIGKGRI